MQTDTAQIKDYLKIHITGKLTPSITDPVHLRWELLLINKQLPARLSLLEDPHGNVWHYYRFLTVNLVIHGGKLVLMIRIPLTDLDSVMDLYKIYNVRSQFYELFSLNNLSLEVFHNTHLPEINIVKLSPPKNRPIYLSKFEMLPLKVFLNSPP